MPSAVTLSRDRLATTWRAAAGRLAAVAGDPTAAARLVWGAWAVTRLILFAAMLAGRNFCDPAFYHYAGEFAAGRWPYRTVPVEYPPLAVALILLPALPLLPFVAVAPRPDPAFADLSHLPQPNPARYGAYGISFAVEMLLVDALTLWLVRRAARRFLPGDAARTRTGLLYVALIFVSGALLQKFDLAAGTLCLAAVLALVEERPAVAGGALALAALVKGFPALALPLFAVYYLARPARLTLVAAVRAQAQPLARCIGAFVVVVTGATLLVVVSAAVGQGLGVGVGAVVHTLTYHAGREFEIESLWGNLMLLAGWLPGLAPATRFNPLDLSRVVHSPLEPVLGALALPALGILVALVYVAALRQGVRPPARPLRREPCGDVLAVLAATVAVLLAFMLAFRALPAHYVLVIAPLAVLLRLGHRRTNGLFLVAVFGVALLGQLLTPAGVWHDLTLLRPLPVVLLTLRNCAWTLAFVLPVMTLWRDTGRASAGAGVAGNVGA